MNLNNFKVNTIQQYHVLEYLKKHFEPNTFIKIESIDRYTMKVVDTDGVTTCFKDTGIEVVRWHQ